MGYEEEYHKTVHSYLESNKEYYNTRAKLAVKKYFKGIEKKEKILEFGCGLGQNIYLIENATGYDISKFAVDFCRKKGINATTDKNKIKDNSFEIVFSNHVLEHLDTPFEYINLMKKKLKKKGKLILVLPVEKHKKARFEIDEHQHLFSWNFRTINNLLIHAGFKIKKNEYKRGNAYRKLLFLNKFSFRLYSFATFLAGLLLNSREMIIIAEK